MEFLINGKPYVRYEIVHLDVWGNACDGFDINMFYNSGELITLPERFTDRDVVTMLKRANVLKRNVRHSSVRVINEAEDWLFIEDERTGEPVVHLRLQEDVK